MRSFYIPVNPEPWAVGSVSVGKRGGKFVPRVAPNPQLVNFQEAIKEQLSDEEPLPLGEYDLMFYFWRRLDSYETQSGRKHKRHWADVTNLQKGCEDALQGVLFDNDRRVRRVTSEVVAQNETIKPCIVICASMYENSFIDLIPEEILAKVYKPEALETVSNNSWPPTEGAF